MDKQGTIYKFQIFSFVETQTGGVICNWRKDSQPIDQEGVLAGEWVELHVSIKSNKLNLDEGANIRFDIFEKDYLISRKSDDRVISFVSRDPQVSSNQLKEKKRTVYFQVLESGKTYQQAVEDLISNDPQGYQQYILVTKSSGSSPSYYVLTWWRVEYSNVVVSPELYFSVEIEDFFKQQTEEALRVNEAKQQGHLDGYLFDSSEKPIARQAIRILNPDSSEYGVQITDDSGSIHFEMLPIGNYKLTVDGYDISVMTSEAATGTLKGMLVDEAGLPLMQQTVRLFKRDGSGQLSQVTDESGAFTFKDLSVGRYELSLEDHEISVASAVSSPAQIESFLIDADGNPLVNQTVRLYKYEGREQIAKEISDFSGKFVFRNVPAGKYRLEIDEYEISAFKTATIDDFISMVKKIEGLHPDFSGEDILNSLRSIAGYDTNFFQKLYGDIPPAKKLILDEIDLWILESMMSHGEVKGFETGIVKDKFGHDLAIGHVLTGISGGQHRIKDLDLTPWYAILFGVVGLLAGEKMDNLYAATISGDLGQSAYMVNEGHYAAPYLGPGTEATFAELIGDIDGVLIGKNLDSLREGKSLFNSSGPAKIPLSKVLQNYYGIEKGSLNPYQVSASSRFHQFATEDMEYLEKQIKSFAVNYTYYKEGKVEGFLSFTGSESEETLEEFKSWLQKMKTEETQ